MLPPEGSPVSTLTRWSFKSHKSCLIGTGGIIFWRSSESAGPPRSILMCVCALFWFYSQKCHCFLFSAAMSLFPPSAGSCFWKTKSKKKRHISVSLCGTFKHSWKKSSLRLANRTEAVLNWWWMRTERRGHLEDAANQFRWTTSCQFIWAWKSVCENGSKKRYESR